MRSLVVVAVDEAIELGLLLEEVVAGRLGGLQLQGQMHALMAAVLCLDRLKREFGLAKGTPLSVRMALGSPNFLKTASNTGKA